MGQIKYIGSMIFIALFSIAIISFAVNFAEDNNAAIDLSDDPELTSLSSNTNSNLDKIVDGGAEDSYQSIVDTTVSQDSGTAQSIGPFAITPTNLISIVRNIMKTGYKKVFGSDSGFSIFLSALTGFLLILAGLYAYKTLRGNPD